MIFSETKTCFRIQFYVDVDNDKNVINGDRILMIIPMMKMIMLMSNVYDDVDDDHDDDNNHDEDDDFDKT